MSSPSWSPGSAKGAEADKRRPAVVVSNHGAKTTAARLGRGVVTVVPVTSNLQGVSPFQVLFKQSETGLGRDSKAPAEHARSITVERIGRAFGRLAPATMERLDDALRRHLAP